MTVHWRAPCELRAPVLVAAFEGWNDAASAASDAVRWLARTYAGELVAELDAEEYFDFQSCRPEIEVVDGVLRRLRWPGVTFLAARTPVGPDLVLAVGPEPNLSWPRFCEDVATVAHETGCTTVVTLGALLADVPHTRPVRLSGSTTLADAGARLALPPSTYEGPTGIVGVLHDAARTAGFEAASLWAAVPHYVATPPCPPATRALLDALGRLTGPVGDLADLDLAAETWTRAVDRAVGDDEDTRRHVAALEARYDESVGPAPEAGALAEDLERFLRGLEGPD